jgi:hypothetical protein
VGEDFAHPEFACNYSPLALLAVPPAAMAKGDVRVILYLWKDSLALTREQVMWLALCALSLIGVLIHSLVDFPLQIASLQLISAVLLGQLWAKLHDKRQLPRTPHVGMHAPLQGDCRN